MELLEAMNIIEDQTWLETPSEQIATAVEKILTSPSGPTRVDDFLNGVWLGHPLHPVLVAVPIGAWTMTVALDAIEAVTGDSRLRVGADTTAALGLAGALASAVTGAAQWQYTLGRPRRLGLAHALVNLTAAGGFGLSLLLRLSGKRRAGKAAAILSYAAVTVGGYIGGELTYRERLGMSHVPEQELPAEWTRALPAAELQDGAMARVTIADAPVLLVRQHGEIHALAAICAHLGGPLAEGTLEEGCVRCPWHSSRFRLTDGSVVNGPATFPLPAYETRVVNGMIEVRPAEPQPIL
jgi:nitrite reductase/ring-hydroxylating ferredoxin subunit/uncharacterized membrane protein